LKREVVRALARLGVSSSHRRPFRPSFLPTTPSFSLVSPPFSPRRFPLPVARARPDQPRRALKTTLLNPLELRLAISRSYFLPHRRSFPVRARRHLRLSLRAGSTLVFHGVNKARPGSSCRAIIAAKSLSPFLLSSPFALSFLLYIYIYIFFRAGRRLPLRDGKNPLKDFLRRIMAVNRQCPRKLVRGTIVPYAW